MASLRPPSAWADAQRAFHRAYDADPTPFNRHPVTVTWRTRGTLDPNPAPDALWEGAPQRVDRGTGPILGVVHVLGGFLWRLASSWRHGFTPDDGLAVTVTRPSDGASMTFGLADDPAPYVPQGRSTGVLVGEFGMNAAACIEIDGQVLWPISPPVKRPPA